MGCCRFFCGREDTEFRIFDIISTSSGSFYFVPEALASPSSKVQHGQGEPGTYEERGALWAGTCIKTGVLPVKRGWTLFFF